MDNSLQKGLQKIVSALETESLDYMIVGGFAVNFYNRARFTNDIDLVLQIYPRHVELLMKHFPEWIDAIPDFKKSAAQGQLFNFFDYESGIKYDIVPYVDSDYAWTAFQRRRRVDFLGVNCYVSSIEDLIIAKLQWYNMSNSEKQLGDIEYLLNELGLNMQYLQVWTERLLINRHELF